MCLLSFWLMFGTKVMIPIPGGKGDVYLLHTCGLHEVVYLWLHTCGNPQLILFTKSVVVNPMTNIIFYILFMVNGLTTGDQVLALRTGEY